MFVAASLAKLSINQYRISQDRRTVASVTNRNPGRRPEHPDRSTRCDRMMSFMSYTVSRREALSALLAMPARALAASPADWTLQQASEQVRTKKISPLELTRACLERIQRLNPRINAFITVMAEQAEVQARQLESELHSGKWRGPLHGIPIGLKDLLDTEGIKTTCASAVFADRVPAPAADVVLRLKKTGTVPIGKQNIPESTYSRPS